MKHSLLFFVCLALGMSSCSKATEETPTRPHLTFPEYTAHVEASDTESRATLSSEYKILWATGDAIAIFNKNSASTRYEIEEGMGTTMGKFKAPNSSQNTEAISGTPLTHNGAIYPYSSTVEMVASGENFVFNGVELPATQYYVANSLPAATSGSSVACMPMVAVSSSTSLQFKNVGAVIKLQLKSGDNEGHKLSSIVLQARTADDTGTSALPLAGSLNVTVAKDGQNPTSTIASSPATSIELILPNVALSKSKATVCYLIVPPVTFEHGFMITAKDNYNNEMILKSKKATTLNRNTLLIMPEIAYKAGTWGSIDDIIIQR